MLETLVVIVIVGAAVYFIGRSLYKSVSGKKSACGCGEACPMNKDKKDELIQL